MSYYGILAIIILFLVTQTEFQRDMLCSHGGSGICVDATYKINDYDFNLLTFMVLDDYQEGISVVWALSNREDKLVLLHILEAIREVMGPSSHCGSCLTWHLSTSTLGIK